MCKGKLKGILHTMYGTVRHQKSDKPCQCGNCKEYGGNHVYSYKFENTNNYKKCSDIINNFCMKQPMDGTRIKITIIVKKIELDEEDLDCDNNLK